MRIAHIHAFGRNGEGIKYYVDYLEIDEEGEDYYTVKDNDDGLAPRNNWLSKEIDLDAADDGYASLNLPGWIKCKPYEVSGIVYVLETEVEKGKEILKQKFLDNIKEEMEEYEKLKKLIQEK